MPRFKLTIEYAGTRYHGWQAQKNARTVQGELQHAVAEVTDRDDFELYGSGRTDAGVHAMGQVAHLDVMTKLEPDRLRWAINDLLPADIHVLSIDRAPHRFHARHNAIARSYLYQVSRRRTAFAKPFVWWVRDRLDLSRMQTAAAFFVGMHDFRSFAAGPVDGEKSETRVLLERVQVAAHGSLILVRVQGSHFVWRMVRRMVGVLVEVGRGGLGAQDVIAFLREHDPRPAELTAPPSGLFLEHVFYEGEAQELPLEPAVPVS